MRPPEDLAEASRARVGSFRAHLQRLLKLFEWPRTREFRSDPHATFRVPGADQKHWRAVQAKFPRGRCVSLNLLRCQTRREAISEALNVKTDVAGSLNQIRLTPAAVRSVNATVVSREHATRS